MKGNEFLIDTDVLLDHLHHSGKDFSLLEKLMSKGICFTTVLNAAELIFKTTHKKSVIDLLNALKVLGVHPKYSLNIDKYSEKFNNYNDALFCAIAEINKLPIVCLNAEKYISTDLEVIIPGEAV